MAIAITKKNREVVFLEADLELPEDQRTGFIMGPVAQEVRDQVTSMIAVGAGAASQWKTVLLRHCLLGFSDQFPFRDEDGDPIKFAAKKGVVKTSILEMMDLEMQTELAGNRLETFIKPDNDEDEGEKELSDLEKSEPLSPTA